MSKKLKKEALAYHEMGQPGKIEVVPTKPLTTQLDLALAYSPGVAEPCLEIEKNPGDSYRYTSRGNLVGVISNGTAVLGLGNIGALASKPVMEGKGVLFKKFAGIDVFDIEIDTEDPDEFIRIVKSLEPTFGGINLEDIKAPESFKIEEVLKKEMNIPLMHDDQHGTAIISAAGLINALELAEKRIDEVKIVVSGAGGSAIASSKLYVALGAKEENIVMLDSKGVIRKDRPGIENDPMKFQFATDRDITTLEEALTGADVFLGLSRGNIMGADEVMTMADKPIIFALANPTPEIAYDVAVAARPDAIIATGRSDYPNQVNNVLGFPYIFRGAMDVRATSINEEMKLASVHALAELAKLPVPQSVKAAYNDNSLSFGPQYLIPKPFDPRLISTVSPAVAKAAIESGVAKDCISDWDAYAKELEARIGIDQSIVTSMITQAQKDPKRVVFTDAESRVTLRAAEIVKAEGIAHPILLGNRERVNQLIEEEGLSLEGCPIINPVEEKEARATYGAQLFEKRKRKGVTLKSGKRMMRDRNMYGCMMLEMGDADAVIAGVTKDYPSSLNPALQVIGKSPKSEKVAGMYIVTNKKQTYFFADTTVNANPSSDDLVDIIGITADYVKSLGIEPRVAVLSYSNFGSAKGNTPEKIAEATQKAKDKYPDLVIDGDIQANVALNTKIQQEMYPFSELSDKGANTLIFPNLSSGNIAYKLLMEIGGAEATGPILLGMNKPVHILQLGASEREIINLTAIAVVDSQQKNH
ncbi:NADP-dependent malic enzyme [Aureibacter tunicatorum]|uniref:Malate dehydrogenase (Oxaloacetate-decarboxylating)(NADP+) n=1 Tax=Aureibacter tunicatorum TaxID=866807 RepID=A0AAE4BRY0_9BACT|nr:NADP-dependent malic enzyme [Aureibacter tunicatorum]MDR6237732.1 malate dehydrogenase (oxaloacetate-decarboxylating)(NADP+) [Aureibacter tunicatorum]BDD02767.1 NADP-dependent malic enzyme [Aureibacter tunicatorum]